jgi:hypothetical protein
MLFGSASTSKGCCGCLVAYLYSSINRFDERKRMVEKGKNVRERSAEKMRNSCKTHKACFHIAHIASPTNVVLMYRCNRIRYTNLKMYCDQTNYNAVCYRAFVNA